MNRCYLWWDQYLCIGYSESLSAGEFHQISLCIGYSESLSAALVIRIPLSWVLGSLGYSESLSAGAFHQTSSPVALHWAALGSALASQNPSQPAGSSSLITKLLLRNCPLMNDLYTHSKSILHQAAASVSGRPRKGIGGRSRMKCQPD